MKTTTLAIAAAMAAGTVAHAQDAVQWRVEDGGNGHWYMGVVRPSGVSFDSARADALAMGGDLGSLELQGENEWVFESVASAPALWVPQAPPSGCCRFGPWIGGMQVAGSAEPSGGWTWVSGVALPDTWPGDYGPNNACSGSSNEDRLHYWGLSGPLDAWNDLPATPTCGPLPRGFIVEFSADCNGDGIVDYGQILDGTFEDANGNGVPDCCEDTTGCDSPIRTVQWTVDVGGNGHWYRTYAYSGCIYENIAFAASRGADLLCVSNGGEWNFVKSAFQPLPPGGFCIGALGPALTGNGWQWSTSEPWTFDAWAGNCGKPDNGEHGTQARAVGCFDPANMEWDDLTALCIGEPILILEYSADCNGDGIVDYGQILDGTFEDADGNGVPDCCDEGVSCDPCPGDVNNDGQVNGADISVLLGFWGLNGKPVAADINKDGSVDGADLAQLLGSWGECP